MNPSSDICELPKIDPEQFEFVNNSEIFDEVLSHKQHGYFEDAMRRLLRNKSAVTAFAIILVITFLALIGPFMSKYGYNEQYVDRINLPPRVKLLESIGLQTGTRVLYNRRLDNVKNLAQYPEGSVLEILREYEVSGTVMVDIKVDAYALRGLNDEYYIMGTDYLGRDLWTRLWRGARISLFIAVLSVMANIFIGIVYGAVAGYYGGRLDMFMMRITEIIGAFPQVIIATMLMILLGVGMRAIIISLIISGWVPTARMIRAQFIRFRDREYVLAASTLGVRDRALIFRHILPNSIGPIITRAMVAIPGAIFTESFLAFVGLGIQAPEPSIGVLLSDAQKVLTTYPYQMAFPGLLISVLMISFNLLGTGLRDAFDPTMRGIE